MRYAYNPHGAVVAQERVRLGAFAYQVQEFRNDAYGNVFYSRTRSSATGDEAPSVADYFNDGLLINRNTILPPPAQSTQSMVDEELVQEGDGGRVTLTGVLVTIPPVNGGGYASQSGGRQYYGPDEKLMVVQRYDFRVGSSASLGSWEEYWYDALGRRILTRARRSGSPPTGTGPLCNDPVGNSCQSYYQRTLWDGDQILYEWRVADGTSTGYNSGTAGYVHVEGIDQPVGLIRSDGTRVINYTWRGLGESSVFVNGSPGDNSITGGSLAVQWPTRTQGGVYFTPNVLASGGSGPFTWFGTLAENGAGSSGLLFRRNRYFDPVSGRFTQADPIGLAGGLNLYGFANGDPVNFTDPFGLCPEDMGGDGKTKSLADCPRGTKGWNRYASGAIEPAPFSLLDLIPIGAAAAGGTRIIRSLGLVDKFSRAPKSLMDQMVLAAAKEGKGVRIIENLGDRRFRGMEKWSYSEKSRQGLRSEVHYVRDPKTGELMDFKFKQHAITHP